jgi:integrase/recombinase XerC
LPTNAKEEGLEELPEVLVEQEIPRFLKAAETVDDLIAVSLMLFSALRVGEVEELRVDDLSLERDELRVRAEVAKSNRERRVPIDRRTVALLSARLCELELMASAYIYPRKEGVAARTVSRTLQNRVPAMAELAEITRFRVTPHTLRHTAITQMLERGIPLEVVRQIAGHEDLETTMIYTHLSTKHVIRTFQEAYGI